ncbi:type VI secretion system tube protein Hcp [Candidatus Pacearchaeota archaeon]|nr:type VI secretion system tube protein Hcp [Candidatus Pacearchaeota archaeon]
MWVEGENLGAIKGGNKEAGLEDSIDVFGFSHSVISPRDAASGMPTGKRQHKPLVVVKEIDQATPLLFQALVDNEKLLSVKLEWRHYNPDSQQVELYFTIELVNAAIASIQEYSAGTMHNPMETVSFVYQKITWTWEDGGYTATDDWEALNV